MGSHLASTLLIINIFYCHYVCVITNKFARRQQIIVPIYTLYKND